MKTRKRKVVLVSVTVLAAVVICMGLCIHQFRKINRRYGHEAVKVSELPGDLWDAVYLV